jgi:chloramphenicol-sensitive protein RarD
LLLLSATILSVNWLIFIWAVTNDRVLETSLGYFINPLVNIMLGVLVLKERLGRVKSVAVVLAVIGVASLVFQGGAFPWVSLSLALTFSVYGLIRKTMPVRSREGLLLETSFMLPIALFYAGYLVWTGQGAFLEVSARIDWLLVAAGAVTALPLIWFATAARRLNYSTVGFFQYIAPSIQFLLAVFLYNEPFSQAHLITFACVWGALLIFTGDSLLFMRRRAR